MNKKIQIRNSPSEFVLNEEQEPTLEGYFIKYNSPAPYGDGWYEQVAPESVHLNRDVLCLYNHNHDMVLGRESAGTFELENRADGLFGRCKLNLDDSDARNIYARVKRGDIKGCSFGFYINDTDTDYDNKLVTLRDIDVFELSVCPFPFYESTTMDARDKFNSLKKEFLIRRFKRWH